jgi:hypothetical protein
VVKINKSYHIDSLPPLSIPTIGIRTGRSRTSITTGRRLWINLRLGYHSLYTHIFYVLRPVVNGYKALATPPTDKDRNKLE